MNRLFVVVLLAGATFVAAQKAENNQEKKIVCAKECTEAAAQLQLKMNSALCLAGDVDKACKGATEFQCNLKGKSDAEIQAAMEARRVMAQERLQQVISRLEDLSTKCQVEACVERIQTRLQQKTEQLKQIQEKMQANNNNVQ